SGEWNRHNLSLPGLQIYNVDSYHDPHDGSKLGKNSIFVLEMEKPRLRIVHLGDLGHRLTEEQRAQIGKVDLLMIPVGGYYTLTLEEVLAVIEHLQPRAVIPVHFRTTHNPHTPIGSVEDFICLNLPYQVKYKDSRVCLTSQELPDQTEIWVMEYMLPAEYPGNTS
ncbi:MAG TPA: MBL fold metallo-hydrolase, partial [Firmicutes bacterium]|nr:MBL fold metallo-hydrolase [Bacillota bacterium]